MPVVGIRELANAASRLVSDVESSREPAVITRRGRPVALIVPVNATALEDFVLANAPEFVESMREGDRELAAGTTVSLSALRAEFAATDAAEDAAEELAAATMTRRSATAAHG